MTSRILVSNSRDEILSEAIRNKGLALFKAGRICESIDIFKEVIEKFPQCSKSRNNLGVAFWFKGDMEKAERNIRQAYQLNPADPQIVLNYGEILDTIGRRHDAIRVFRSFLQIRNDDHITNALSDISTGSSTTAPDTREKNGMAVFISDTPMTREAKMAYGLKSAGWDVVLLCKNNPTFNASDFFKDFRKYSNPHQALHLARTFNADVYHMFAKWDFSTASTIIKNRPGKVVFDDYDVMAGHVKKDFADKNYPGQLEMERFCLENADGLCCRCMEARQAKVQMGYRFKGKLILFLDYCWNLPENGGSQLQKNRIGNDIHVVYVGNLELDPYVDSPFAFHLWLAEGFAAQRINYHIYPPPVRLGNRPFSEIFSKYFDYEAKNPFFHFHRPVDPLRLVDTLKKYDYGLLILSKGIEGKESQTYYTQKYQNAVGNKIFDYFDAGLPILIHPGRFSMFIAKRYGGAIEADEHLLLGGGLIEKHHDSAEIDIMRSKNAYCVRTHIQRLIRFYNQL